MKKPVPVKSTATLRRKLGPRKPANWQPSRLKTEANWSMLRKSLRLTTIMPLGSAIAAAVGLGYSNLASLMYPGQLRQARFARLYNRALLELRPNGKLRPVAAHLATLPRGEKVFVDAQNVWVWLREADEQLPPQLDDWLKSQETLGAQIECVEGSNSAPEATDQAATRPAVGWPIATIDVTLKETAKDSDMLRTAWGTLGMVLLHNFRAELDAHTWTYLPLREGRKREVPGAEAQQADAYEIAEDTPEISSMKNHVATAIVAAIGIHACAENFPKMAKHFDERGLKRADFKRSNK